MSFKELLLEAGADTLVVEKLLPIFLELKSNEINESIALILAQFLFPGSQDLPYNFGLTNSIPEATATGAKFQTSLRSIDSNGKLNVNWNEVFSEMEKKLHDYSQRQAQPDANGINQVISSLDFKPGVLDSFLAHNWWFSRTLLYVLVSLDVLQGSYDLKALKNLKLCFDDAQSDGSVTSVVEFLNIAQLELVTLDQIQILHQNQHQFSEFETKLIVLLNQMFDRDARLYPECFLCAALLMEAKSQFIRDFITTFFTLLLDSNNVALQKIVSKFLEVDQDLILIEFISYYVKRPIAETSTKELTLAKTYNFLEGFLNKCWQTDSKIGLAMLIDASSFGYDFKKVIELKLSDSKERDNIFRGILELLEIRAPQDYEKEQQQVPLDDPSYKQLGLPVVSYLLDKLKTGKRALNPERLKNLQLLLLTTYPRLINYGFGHDEAILKNSEHSNSFPPEVEQEMKSYYSKMYNKEMEIKEIVEMLLRMKSSDVPHDQDVFACMIHSLLDEYRFFSEYPLSALASTSLLFGALLEKDLIQGNTLTVALNFIWESCNQPQDSHLFKFAVQSLYNFKSRLHEYPSYCKHLLECQSLASHAKMYQIVKNAANGIPRVETNMTPTPDVGPKYQSITVVDRQIGNTKDEEPSDVVSDKLLFQINNMTEENMKVDEIKELLEERYFLWFAEYLISERAKTEPNNHGLYAALVNKLDNRIFYEYVLSISIRESEKIIKNFKDGPNEKTNLKNLGAWIGRLTLSQDRPLVRSKIALKFLLLEAYEFGTLPVIIPFVCKILDQAQYSTIFKPPNPWILGIIEVLVELYEISDLKLSLKFEIEVLLNSFNMKIQDVQASNVVRTFKSKSTSLASFFGLHPETVTVVNDMARLALEGPEGSTVGVNQLQSQLPQQSAHQQLQQQQQIQPESQLDTTFSTLIGNTIFTEHANLRRAFQASLSRAVRECAVPILTRVSEAVLTTTEALVRKDFACEADVNKFHRSYQTLAQELSHSMVVCTGRKILSEAIEATMLQLLGSVVSELPVGELNSAIQANVGLCVNIVDKIAADNISELINERMLKDRVIREQHRPGEPFVDGTAYEYAMHLPPPLGLNPEGLEPNQLQIYETFGSNGPAAKAEVTQSLETQPASQDAALTDDLVTFETLFNAVTQFCEKAIQLLGDSKETKLSDLDPNHPILTYLSQALTVAQNNALKFPELLLKAAQYAVNFLFTQQHENPMSNEIYVVFLDKLCEFSPSTAKDVTWWLVHSSDQRKFNMPVIYSLLKVQLIQATKLDASLGALINETTNPIVVKFASELLFHVFSSEDQLPIALRSEFSITLDALLKYSGDAGEEHSEAKVARDNLFTVLDQVFTPKFGLLYSQMGYIFAEWIKLATHGENTTDLQEKFVEKLLTDEILTNPDYFEAFFKASTEISVTAFATEHEIRARTQHDSYLAVDTFAMLIVKIVLRFEDENEAIDYFQNIIGIILLVLTNDHETSTGTWNERAYFRLFSSLLATWNAASINDENATKKLDSRFYPLIGEVFNSLQPIIVPGFTFAWISLISHRMFLPRLLELPEKQGYSTVVKLLTAILKFQSVYFKDAHNDVIFVIFKAINRIFVGLAHDYPGFLSDCHYQLVTAVPREYIQLRNIILSATPSNISVPDPFTQGLKVERLPEINNSPVIAYKPIEDLQKVGLKKPVDNFLRIPAPVLMRNIYCGTKLNHPKEVCDWGFDVVHYNVKLINALVLHVGISAVSDKAPGHVRGFNTKSSYVALLVDLMNHGSLEFKFHLVNAIANQLRFPNSHTHWFIGIILHFFSSSSIWGSPANKVVVQEIITRILLERRIVSKPHPWGLTIVFTELVKNGDYGFFDLPFVKSAIPELKTIFDALAINFKGNNQITEA